ncbi:MAG: glycosyltransferase family 4 protein [Xenococcus sp. MO_188.B8]|nr:glycosyltransferase family 4 protein [Xenococcus sp. MO_188.B8]
MNILVVTSHDILNDISGTPKHILKLVSEFAKRNHKVLVLHLKYCANQKLTKYDYQYGVFVYEIPPIQWFLGSLKLIKDFDAQVCIAFTYGAAGRFLPVLKIYEIPLLYEVHTVFKNVPVTSIIPYTYEQLEKKVCKYAQHMVVLGNEVKKMYVNQRKLDKDKISVIYPSVTIDEFVENFQAGRFHEKKTDTINVTYLGNLIFDNNGIDILLDAAKIVCSRSQNINFIFAGQPYDSEKKYPKQLYELGGRVKFVYINNTSEVKEIMDQSDILAHTRRYSLDSLSVQSKLAVYMANGKPIVATNFADYQYLIHERQCGYAIEPYPELIAQGILQLSNSIDSRMMMGLNSFNTAKKYFNLSTAVDRYLTILNSISRKS